MWKQIVGEKESDTGWFTSTFAQGFGKNSIFMEEGGGSSLVLVGALNIFMGAHEHRIYTGAADEDDSGIFKKTASCSCHEWGQEGKSYVIFKKKNFPFGSKRNYFFFLLQIV